VGGAGRDGVFRFSASNPVVNELRVSFERVLNSSRLNLANNHQSPGSRQAIPARDLLPAAADSVASARKCARKCGALRARCRVGGGGDGIQKLGDCDSDFWFS